MNREIPHLDDDEKDIRDVRREEMSRGRRPRDTEQEELARKLKRDFEELLLNGDGKQFELFLIAHGQEAGTEKFELSMKKWQTYQTERRARQGRF